MNHRSIKKGNHLEGRSRREGAGLVLGAFSALALVAVGCVFDQSGLRHEVGNNNATCGNGVLEATEACDGADLGGETCGGLGFSGGTLLCASDCQVDTSGCTGPGPVCGDGVAEGSEACDGADLGGETCGGLGYYGGTLRCRGDCSRYDESGCSGRCGDGVINGAEACDGADLGGETCGGLGFSGGTLLCASDCQVDASGCTGPGPVCGDGAINGSEVCDGVALGGETCGGLGYYGGTLGCLGDCSGYDESGCAGSCGDGVVNGPEECDGGDLNGADCSSLGCRSGSLACAGDCSFDPSGCYLNHDEDGDGVDDNCDNCPTYPNPGQGDVDADAVGGVCEAGWDAGLLSTIPTFDPFLDAAVSWSADGGTWTQGTDVVTGSQTWSGGNYLHSVSLQNVDYSVEAMFQYDQSRPNNSRNWTAVVFAWRPGGSGSLHAYECTWERRDQTLGLWRISGYSWNSLAAAQVTTSSTGAQWHRLRGYRQGDAVRCVYEDQSGATETVQATGGDVDADMSGQVGIRVYNEISTFRSFVVYQ